jgi:hypothetical protein
MTNEIVLQWNPSATPVSGYNVYRGTLPGNEGVAPINATLVTVFSPGSISSVAAAVSGSTTYAGSFSGGAGNAWAGFSFKIAGFGNASNNGTFACTASTATSLTLDNTSGVAETHVALANQIPQYTDSNVYPGVSYSYEITAVSGGVESADSLGIESTPVPYGPTPDSPAIAVGLDSFIVLAATTVTSTGATNLSGDVGTYPGTSITGFPPGVISGVFHAADYVAANGEAAAQQLYNALMLMTSTQTISGDLGGQTLTPGVYTSSSTIGVTGILTLDAQGDPNAVWVFQIGSALTTAASDSAILLVNGAQAANVFWQVGSSATIGTDTTFVGTIVAQASITVNTSATVNGRLLALTGAITLAGNNVVLFNMLPFAGNWQANTEYSAGEVTFDDATNSFQEVVIAGTSGATRPTFNGTVNGTTTDGSVTWLNVSPASALICLALPPSPPNVPPAPPTAPTGLAIVLES